jgi:hypothetical protein
VRVDGHAGLHFLELGLDGLLLRFLQFLFLLVDGLFVVVDLADGWLGIGSDFDEVESGFFRTLECILDGNDANLLTVLGDQAYFASANGPVGTCFVCLLATDGRTS